MNFELRYTGELSKDALSKYANFTENRNNFIYRVSKDEFYIDKTLGSIFMWLESKFLQDQFIDILFNMIRDGVINKVELQRYYYKYKRTKNGGGKYWYSHIDCATHDEFIKYQERRKEYNEYYIEEVDWTEVLNNNEIEVK